MKEQEAIDLGYADAVKSFQYLHGQIMGAFDFEKVHKVMTFLEWKWGAINEAHVPSIEELKTEATILLKEAYTNKDVVSIRSGGFNAGWGDDELFLDFVLEWAETK